MEEAIISSVFAREEIWSPKNRNHKNVYVLQRKWREVAEELGKDVKSIKRKWKYLRDYFIKERRKIVLNKTDENSEEGICTWQYYNLLLFLNDVISNDNTDSSLISDIQTDIKEELNEVQVETSTVYAESDIKPKRLSQNSGAIKRRNNLREDTYPSLEHSNAKLSKRNSQDENYQDEDLMFFKSLLPDIKSLSKQRKRRLKLKIQELVVKEVEESERNISLSK